MELTNRHTNTETINSGQALQAKSSWSYGGPIGPVVASILAMIAWAVFILIYALFWSSSFNLFQNIIVTLVSLMIVGLLIGLMWVVWGSRAGWKGD